MKLQRTKELLEEIAINVIIIMGILVIIAFGVLMYISSIGGKRI